MAEDTTIMQEPNTQEPTPQPSSITEPADQSGEKTLSFSQDDYKKFMAQEKAAGKRAIMKQFGITEEKDLPGAVAKFTAYMEAEAKAEADKPELERLRDELASAKAFESKYSEASSRLQAYEQERLVMKYGFSKNPDETPEDYEERLQDTIALINRRISDEKDFAQASEDYFKKNPIKSDAPPKPEIHPITPVTRVTSKSINPNVAAAAKGAGIDPSKLTT